MNINTYMSNLIEVLRFFFIDHWTATVPVMVVICGLIWLFFYVESIVRECPGCHRILLKSYVYRKEYTNWGWMGSHLCGKCVYHDVFNPCAVCGARTDTLLEEGGLHKGQPVCPACVECNHQVQEDEFVDDDWYDPCEECDDRGHQCVGCEHV